MKAAARRHRETLGEVLAVHRNTPGPGTVVAFVLAWIAMSGLTFINPGETLLIAVAPTIGFLLIAVIIFVMISGERLVVCQRGLLVGSVAPFLRPYAIGFEQMAIGSVVPISAKLQRYSKETRRPSQAMSPSLRIYWWARRGVALVGPHPSQTRGRAGDSDSRYSGPAVPWLVGTRDRAEQVTADIARAAFSAGFTDLAQQTAGAPPRELTGRPADAQFQLPGHPVGR